MTTSNPTRLTPMHYKHLELGAAIVESDGWQRPARYASVEQEIEHVKKAVGIGDVSPVGKINIQGDELDFFLSTAFPGIDLPNIGGVSRYPASGGLDRDALTLLRLAHDEIMVLTHPSQSLLATQDLGVNLDLCAHVVDVTSGLAGVRITGPFAKTLLTSITEIDLAIDAFPDMSCAQVKAAEIHNVLLRFDLGGLPTYEMYFGREFGEYMWDALLEVGEEYQVKPVGIEAMARLQSG